MNISDLTLDELKELVKGIVDDRLRELLGECGVAFRPVGHGGRWRGRVRAGGDVRRVHGGIDRGCGCGGLRHLRTQATGAGQCETASH